MEGAPGSDPSCWGEKAGRPASHITKCLILSSQYKRQGLAFIFHQTCWIGSKMGLWMQPGQAHAPHPWFLNPGKKVTKERAQRQVGQSGKNPGTSPNSSSHQHLDCHSILQSRPPSPGSNPCPPPAQHPNSAPHTVPAETGWRGPLSHSMCFPPPELDGRLSNSWSLIAAAHLPSLNRKHHPSPTAQKPSPQFWGPQRTSRWGALAPREGTGPFLPTEPISGGGGGGKGQAVKSPGCLSQGPHDWLG